MPACSVVFCKNTSIKVNYNKDGISFHMFPKDPTIKEAWINATGRGPNWFPTKNQSAILYLFTTISHFTDSKPALDTSKLRVNLNSSRPTFLPAKIKPEDRRKSLPLFPKKMKKFVVSEPTPHKSSIVGTNKFVKPALRHLPLATSTAKNRYEPKVSTKRPSMMKAMKYVGSDFERTDDIENEEKNMESMEQNSGELFDSNEEPVTELPSSFEDYTDKSDKNYNIERTKRYSQTFWVDPAVFGGISEEIEFIKALNEDKLEYLFLDDNEWLTHPETSEVMTESNLRNQRDIIIEESMASTTSPLRFTGSITNLQSDLTYKNIHQ